MFDEDEGKDFAAEFPDEYKMLIEDNVLFTRVYVGALMANGAVLPTTNVHGNGRTHPDQVMMLNLGAVVSFSVYAAPQSEQD